MRLSDHWFEYICCIVAALLVTFPTAIFLNDVLFHRPERLVYAGATGLSVSLGAFLFFVWRRYREKRAEPGPKADPAGKKEI